MTSGDSNTYHFSCRVIEVIYKDDKRVIRAMCNPGSLVIETPDEGGLQLGDRFMVTGTLRIQNLGPGIPSENH